jgi:hypothetical protein
VTGNGWVGVGGCQSMSERNQKRQETCNQCESGVTFLPLFKREHHADKLKFHSGRKIQKPTKKGTRKTTRKAE